MIELVNLDVQIDTIIRQNYQEADIPFCLCLVYFEFTLSGQYDFNTIIRETRVYLNREIYPNQS